MSRKFRATQKHVEEGLKQLKRANFADAEASFRRALKQDPENAGLIFHVGLCLCNMDRNEEGLRMMRRALHLEPEDAKRWWNYANSLFFAGHYDDSKRAMVKAVDMMPGKISPLYNYCTTARVYPDDPLVDRLREMMARKKLNRIDQSFANYALAKVYERAEEYERAFDYAIAGGQAYGVQCNLDERRVDDLIRANTREALTRRPCGGDPTEAPVFIVGMPRSGTTFTETVLSSHRDVLGAGELGAGRTGEILAMTWAKQHTGIRNGYEAVRTIVPQVEEVAAQYYMSQVHGFAGGQVFRRFTDKLPENVFRLGLLSRFFPNARVIVIHRHPLDNCTSCLFQRFNDVQYSYTNTIPALAAQYRAFQKILAHWREVLPLQMTELVYEDLVANFEPEVRRLIDFLGLDWDPACLDPGSTRRTVRTASAGQIRDGVNRSSIEKWRRYESRLGPLIDELGGMEQIERWAHPAA